MDRMNTLQMSVWIMVGVFVFIIIIRFCCWCSEQETQDETRMSRVVSTVAIIGQAAPEPMSCPHCLTPQTQLPSLQNLSLPPAYPEDPPPPYSAVVGERTEARVRNTDSDC